MHLEDGQNVVELRVLGYQSRSAECSSDLDWLLIVVRAVTAGARIERIDPCLEVREAHRLRTWLAAVGAGTEASAQITFLEPNLQFAWSTDGSDHVLVTADLADTLHPDWPAGNDP